MTGRRSAALALLVLASALLAAGVAPAPVAASSPPEATPFCERPLARSLGYSLPNATLESTTARAVVENTSAEWTVNATFRNRSAVERILGNGTLERRVVADASGAVPPADVNVSAAGPRALSFRFLTDDFAARTPGGLLRVDYFHVRGSEFRSVSCDRLTVAGPPGHVLAARPTETTGTVRADGERVVVADSGGYGRMTFLVFAPESMSDSLAEALASLAVALAVSGTVARNVALVVCPPSVVVALGFVSLRRLFSSPSARFRARVREFGVTALALLLVGVTPLALLLFFDQSPLFVVVPGVVAGGAVAAFGSGGRSRRASFAPVVAGASAAGVTAVVCALLGLIGPATAVTATFALVPVLAGYPLGDAAARGRSARDAAAVAAVGFAAATAAYVPLTVAGDRCSLSSSSSPGSSDSASSSPPSRSSSSASETPAPTADGAQRSCGVVFRYSRSSTVAYDPEGSEKESS